MKKTTKKALSNNIVIGVVVLFVLSILTTIFITALAQKTKTSGENRVTPTAELEKEDNANQNTYANAVFLDADIESKRIAVQDVDTGEEYLFSYSGSTKIMDKYDQLITASQISKGQIVRIVYHESSNQLDEIRISNDIWENIGITQLRVNKEAQIITYLGKNFSYSKGTVFLSQGTEITIDDILPMDYVTIRGYEENIYSLIVTKGHGYLELTDEEPFIGGSIYVGTLLMEQITQHMILTVGEGEYEITVENKNSNGSKVVEIQRDKTTQMSLKEFETKPARTSLVAFDIEPELAQLYVDGKETNYLLPVELEYGPYEIEVSMGGYVTYKGNIQVQEPNQSITICLQENDTSVPDEGVNNQTDPYEDNDHPDSTNEDESSNNSTSDTETITIEWTTGAEVYFDGTLVGTIEDGALVTKKKIGTFDIDLVLPGEDTVSFVVTVEDDGEDVVFSFPN